MRPRVAIAGFVGIALAALSPVAGAGTLTLQGTLTQGALIVGKTDPGAHVVQDGRKLRVGSDGTFVIGFGRDANPSSTLDVTFPDGTKETRTLSIAKRDYKIQRVEGLPPKKVTPSKEALKRIRKEQKLINAARAHDTGTPWFVKGFVWPTQGRISGVYGSQRILNGKPRNPHLGLDIAAPKGTKVVAAAAGVIRMAQPDMFFTGNTLVIDHGFGVNSVYAHLSKITVKVGQHVAQGETVGEVGATGRATGPHLHWGLDLFQQRLDPALVVGPMPGTAAGQ